MEERTKLYSAGDQAGIDALEKKLLAQNAQHKDSWKKIRSPGRAFSRETGVAMFKSPLAVRRPTSQPECCLLYTPRCV